MRPAALGLALGLFLSSCASTPAGPARSEVIRQVLPSAVQLRAERAEGARRSASGVVIASDAASKRSWILTARHFLDPAGVQDVYISAPARKGRVKATVSALSQDADLALIEVAGLALPPVRLKDVVRLGDEVLVVAFPWGRRLTVVSGVVSQLKAEEGEAPVEGTIHMVDASVSYGSSGGGVFDAETGALVGLVEGYRTAQVATPGSPERVLQLPVAGETTVIPCRAIVDFLAASGLDGLVRR